MKKLNFLLFFLLFAFINSTGRLSQTYYPSYLISKMDTKFTTLANTVDKEKIDQIGALGIPKHAVEKFKAAKFALSFYFSKKHCTESFFYKPRGFTIYELNSIKSAMKNRSTSELKERIQKIQNLSRYYPK